MRFNKKNYFRRNKARLPRSGNYCLLGTPFEKVIYVQFLFQTDRHTRTTKWRCEMRSASSFSARCHKQAGIDILNFNRRYKTPHSGSGVGRMVDKQRYAMYVQKSTQKRTMPMCQYLANPTPKPTWWGHGKPTLCSLSPPDQMPFSLFPYVYLPANPCGYTHSRSMWATGKKAENNNMTAMRHANTFY